ncbi:MAG: DUF2007 domain-containing protein [Chloroflexi bacterium]|nr:DUF2007 domain-containing protein [Chloroflexota bacterium]
MVRKPAHKTASDHTWIAVYITHNLPEAHIVLGRLRAHGIPAMLHQEAGASALGITYGNLGEIKLLVSPADYDQAAALLHDNSSPALEANNAPVQLIWQQDDTREE